MVQNIGANTSPNTPILFCKNKLACKVTIFFFEFPKKKAYFFNISYQTPHFSSLSFPILFTTLF